MPDEELSNVNLEAEPSETDPFNIDGIWKDFIVEFWREILERFLPELYKKADLEREPEFLDKELRDLLPYLEQKNKNKKANAKYVDKLLKIFLKGGGEEWVLLHIEIQGRGGRENFSLRMFRYHCLIFIHHDRHPAALAILTAKRPKKEGAPGIYNYKFFGTEINYKYNVVNAYAFTDEELKSSGSFVDLFIYALKKSKENRKSKIEKGKYMREILKLLEERGLSQKKRRVFVIFVERALELSMEEYDEIYCKESGALPGEGGKKTMVPYNSAIDRFCEKVAEKVTKEVTEKERNATARTLIGLGLLSDEQIALATRQTPEEIALLRSELEMTTV